jgi:pilus assembly protein CpaB
MAAKRYSLVFYGAVIVAVVATYGVWRVIESTKASNRIVTGPVVVATRDIPEALIIDRLALAVAQWPLTTIPPGAYTRIDSVAGRVTKVPIFNGEPLVPGRLAPQGTSPGLETKITPGKRAMSVRVNDVSGVAGMIQPNSRVDILYTGNPGGDGEGRKSKLFMNNMRILAMGQQTQRGQDGRPIQTSVATIEVTPEEGELLAVALSQGSFQLLLRGYGDPDSVETRGATGRDVAASLRDVGSQKASRPATRASVPRISAPAKQVEETAPAPAPAPPPVVQKVAQKPDSLVIQMFKGSKRTDVKLPRDSIKPDTGSTRR